MNEIDLIQAYYGAVNLAYTSSTWWLTVSTALIVSTYFAGKHIPLWLMAVTLVLYTLTAVSVIYELSAYSSMALDYAQRLAALRGTKNINEYEVGTIGYVMNSFANYAVFVLGTLAAVGYSFFTWRGARRAAALEAQA